MHTQVKLFAKHIWFNLMHRKRDKWQTHPQTLFAWKDASKTINNKVINIKAKKVTVVLSTVDSSVKPKPCWCQRGQHSSGLQNWQADVTIIGCQFIGHHLVPHGDSRSNEVTPKKKKNRKKHKELRLCVAFGGSLQVTAPPLEQTQLPHGVAVTSSEHQKLLLQVGDDSPVSSEGRAAVKLPEREKAPRLTQDSDSEAAALVRGESPLCEWLWPDNFLLPVLLPEVNGIIARTLPTARPKGQGLYR